MVAPSGSTSPVASATRSRLEWPPLTSRARHGAGSGPCSSWSTATWAARWLTPYSGLFRGSAEALAAATPPRQPPGQARAGRDRDRVHVGQGDPGRGQGPVHRRDHGFQVRAAGHLGDDAAVAGVLVHAGGDRVSQQFVTADQAGAGLVARGLDAEYQGTGHRATSRRITMASIPDGW